MGYISSSASYAGLLAIWVGVRESPVTEALCKEVLSLPIFPELGETRQALVIDAIRSF